ncbi:MAG: L,D-transpeptidase [Catonella sp.]
MNKIKKFLAGLVIIAAFIGVTDTVKAYSPPEPDFFHTIYIKPPITNSIIYKSETYLKTKFGRINLNEEAYKNFRSKDKINKKAIFYYVSKHFKEIKYSLILKKYDGKEVNIKRVVAGISNETVKKAIADNIYQAVQGKKKGNLIKLDLNKILNETYIEVDLKNQIISQVVKGKRVITANVVTGDTKKKAQTSKGLFTVIYMQKNRVLHYRDFDNSFKSDFVERWMRFDDANSIGIHDAPWRKNSSDWSKSAYKNGHGSHGCVNTPTEAVKTIYDNAYNGMPVVVY